MAQIVDGRLGPVCWRDKVGEMHELERLREENRELRRIANEALQKVVELEQRLEDAGNEWSEMLERMDS
jgi:cell shape-determining protein MreC